MIIAPYQTTIKVGEVYSQGKILYRVTGWITHRGVSEIILKNIGTNRNLKVLSCHWEESEFVRWPFKLESEI